jgi:hypothetical protein
MASIDAEQARGFVVSPEVFVQEIEGESILLDLQSGNYFGLNAVGTCIWALLAEGKSVAETVAAIEAEFDAPAAVIRDDVRGLLTELREKGLRR